jgi:hypothetical protein
MHPNGPLRINAHRIVTLDPEVATVTLTLAQAQALNRLVANGWKVDLSTFVLASDGMLEGEMVNGSGYALFVGIHPSGSTHT